MESEDLVGRLRDYMAVESEFYHHKFMNKTRQLRDVDELHEIIDLLHANYLVQKQLFKELARHVSSEGYPLPSIAKLLGK
tara:strand:+ start:2380 stop:2619 length:240 start_codon:yes stop_codon:yes gene_type:complete